MERALDGKPVADFREPTEWPVWRSFHRGPYALSYDPYYVPPSPPPAEPEPEDEPAPPGKGKDEDSRGGATSDDG
jgi:hypothetical protein